MPVISPEELAYLKGLKPRAFRQGTRLAFTAPTWAMRPKKAPFNTFLPELTHPQRGIIARRDYGNLPSAAMHPFFSNPNIIDDNARIDDTILEDSVPSVVWVPDSKHFKLHPRLHPKSGMVYWLAADLSVNGDCTGLAMVHVEQNGIIELDFSLKIESRPRVDYRPIEQFWLSLRDDLGFTIGGIAFDVFGSNRTRHEMEEHGFHCEVVRYADSFAGCSTISDLVHSGHLGYHKNRDKDFIGEAKELQNVNDKRIDHLSSGGVYNSKDVWDAVVNATTLALADDKTASVRLSEDDIQTFDLHSLELEAAKAKIDKRPTPQHIAHIYTRLHEEKDPNVFTMVRIAKDADSGALFVLEAMRRHEPMNGMITIVRSLLQEWAAQPFQSTLRRYPCEVTTDKGLSADTFSDSLRDSGTDLMLSQIEDDLSVAARIEATKELVLKKNLRFPGNWHQNHDMSRLVRRLLAHPYSPDDYDLRALIGAAKIASELERPRTQDSSSQLRPKTITVRGL